MSPADEDRPTGNSGDAAHIVRTAGVVIYATFLLLVLAIPQSLVNRLNDLDESAVQKILLQGASAVQAASRAARLEVPYRRARSAFLALTGKEDESRSRCYLSRHAPPPAMGRHSLYPSSLAAALPPSLQPLWNTNP